MSLDQRLRTRVERAIRERVFPGCIIGVVRETSERAVLPFGHLTYEADAPEVRENTVYDLASITKALPVASLALLLNKEGKLALNDTVAHYIPELRNHHNATIEDLLRYRVAGPRLSTLPFTAHQEVRAHILETGFEGPPGDERYANAPAFLLGIVLERAGAASLDKLAERYLFAPLGMHHTFFSGTPRANVAERASIAPTEIIESGEVRGIVHDESARLFAKDGQTVGHAGLFSTAPDILNFLEALLAGDLAPVIRGAEKGLGWQTAQPWFMGRKRGPHTFGKTGFTGTSILIDRRHDTALAILSNRTYPHRPSDSSAINAFRADIATAVLG